MGPYVELRLLRGVCDELRKHVNIDLSQAVKDVADKADTHTAHLKSIERLIAGVDRTVAAFYKPAAFSDNLKGPRDDDVGLSGRERYGPHTTRCAVPKPTHFRLTPTAITFPEDAATTDRDA